MVKVLVDQTIALRGRRVTESGHVVVRYDGAPVDDVGLVAHAIAHGFDVLVLSGDAFLGSDEMLARAVSRHLTLAVSREPHPVRASERVLAHADALVALPAGSVVRLLADGPRLVSDIRP